MSSRHIRWGIVGSGAIARRFAGQLPQTATGVAVAVAGRSMERVRAFASEIGPDIRVHASPEDLFAHPEVDAVYVATPHTEHGRLATLALEAGKHVLCEKPIATDSYGAMALIEAARRSQRYFAEAYMYRFHPQIDRLRELILDGAIGEVQHIAASNAFDTAVSDEHRLLNPALAGGGILDVGGYPLSAVRLVAGLAIGARFANPERLTGHGHLTGKGVDDWATASLAFASGITAHVSCGVRLAVPRQLTVWGTGGWIDIPAPWSPQPGEPATLLLRRPGHEPIEEQIPGAYSYALEADAVATAVDRITCAEGSTALGSCAEGSTASESENPFEADQMPWADSLGLARDQDRWREAVGVQYPFEREDSVVLTATGRPLARRPDAVMRYGRIPGIDRDVSRLVMGVNNHPTVPKMSVVLDDFVERGGNLFDTARHYAEGRMERLFGRWLANRGNRAEVIILGKGAHTPHCTPEGIQTQLHASLEAMGVSNVDLYLMHRDNADVPVGEFVDVLDELATAGLMTVYGGSNWSTERYEAANAYADAHGKRRFMALSNHFGLARALDTPWPGAIHFTDVKDRAWLERTQTVLLPWSSQARGFFARGNPADRSEPDQVRCYYSDENFERQRRARDLATAKGVSPTAIALAYVLAQPFPAFPLIGPRSLDETRDSFTALRVPLSAEEVAWLDLRRSGAVPSISGA